MNTINEMNELDGFECLNEMYEHEQISDESCLIRIIKRFERENECLATKEQKQAIVFEYFGFNI